MTPVHFDVEAIVRARVSDLKEVFHKRYEADSAQINAVLCAGINNVGDDQNGAEILKEFADFQNAIYDHSKTHGHIGKGQEKNTLSIVPVIVPP